MMLKVIIEISCYGAQLLLPEELAWYILIISMKHYELNE